jgi:hypothetical protein
MASVYASSSSSELVDDDKISAPGYYQKPGADVALIQNAIAIERAGDVFSVNVQLRTGQSQGLMSVQLRTSDGLSIIAGDTQQKIELDGSLVYDFLLNLYAPTAGKYYLPITVVMDAPNGQRSQRSLSMIVRVGASTDTRTIQGNKGKPFVKSLPAEEDVQ